MVFSRPGRGPGIPFGPFGLPRVSLGATSGVTLAPEVGRKERKRTHLLHVAFSSRS